MFICPNFHDVMSSIPIVLNDVYQERKESIGQMLFSFLEEFYSKAENKGKNLYSYEVEEMINKILEKSINSENEQFLSYLIYQFSHIADIEDLRDPQFAGDFFIKKTEFDQKFDGNNELLKIIKTFRSHPIQPNFPKHESFFNLFTGFQFDSTMIRAMLFQLRRIVFKSIKKMSKELSKDKEKISKYVNLTLQGMKKEMEGKVHEIQLKRESDCQAYQISLNKITKELEQTQKSLELSQQFRLKVEGNLIQIITQVESLPKETIMDPSISITIEEIKKYSKKLLEDVQYKSTNKKKAKDQNQEIPILNNYVHQIKEKDNEIAILKRQIEGMKKIIEENQSNSNSKDSLKPNTFSLEPQSPNSLTKLQEAIKQTSADFKKAVSEKEVMFKQIEEMKNEMKELYSIKNSFQKANKEKDELIQKLQEVQNENEKMKTKYANAKKIIAEQNTKYDSFMKQVKKLQDKIQHQKLTIKNFQSSQNQINFNASNDDSMKLFKNELLIEEINSQSNSIIEREMYITQLQKENMRLVNENESLNETNNLSQERINSLKDNIAELNRLIEARDSQYTSLKKSFTDSKFSKIQNELNDTLIENNHYKQLLKKNSKQYNSLKELAMKIQNDNAFLTSKFNSMKKAYKNSLLESSQVNQNQQKKIQKLSNQLQKVSKMSLTKSDLFDIQRKYNNIVITLNDFHAKAFVENLAQKITILEAHEKEKDELIIKMKANIEEGKKKLEECQTTISKLNEDYLEISSDKIKLSKAINQSLLIINKEMNNDNATNNIETLPELIQTFNDEKINMRNQLNYIRSKLNSDDISSVQIKIDTLIENDILLKKIKQILQSQDILQYSEFLLQNTRILNNIKEELNCDDPQLAQLEIKKLIKNNEIFKCVQEKVNSNENIIDHIDQLVQNDELIINIKQILQCQNITNKIEDLIEHEKILNNIQEQLKCNDVIPKINQLINENNALTIIKENLNTEDPVLRINQLIDNENNFNQLKNSIHFESMEDVISKTLSFEKISALLNEPKDTDQIFSILQMIIRNYNEISSLFGRSYSDIPKAVKEMMRNEIKFQKLIQTIYFTISPEKSFENDPNSNPQPAICSKDLVQKIRDMSTLYYQLKQIFQYSNHEKLIQNIQSAFHKLQTTQSIINALSNIFPEVNPSDFAKEILSLKSHQIQFLNKLGELLYINGNKVNEEAIIEKLNRRKIIIGIEKCFEFEEMINDNKYLKHMQLVSLNLNLSPLTITSHLKTFNLDDSNEFQRAGNNIDFMQNEIVNLHDEISMKDNELIKIQSDQSHFVATISKILGTFPMSQDQLIKTITDFKAEFEKMKLTNDEFQNELLSLLEIGSKSEIANSISRIMKENSEIKDKIEMYERKISTLKKSISFDDITNIQDLYTQLNSSKNEQEQHFQQFILQIEQVLQNHPAISNDSFSENEKNIIETLSKQNIVINSIMRHLACHDISSLEQKVIEFEKENTATNIQLHNAKAELEKLQNYNENIKRLFSNVSSNDIEKIPYELSNFKNENEILKANNNELDKLHKEFVNQIVECLDIWRLQSPDDIIKNVKNMKEELEIIKNKYEKITSKVFIALPQGNNFNLLTNNENTILQMIESAQNTIQNYYTQQKRIDDIQDDLGDVLIDDTPRTILQLKQKIGLMENQLEDFNSKNSIFIKKMKQILPFQFEDDSSLLEKLKKMIKCIMDFKKKSQKLILEINKITSHLPNSEELEHSHYDIPGKNEDQISSFTLELLDSLNSLRDKLQTKERNENIAHNLLNEIQDVTKSKNIDNIISDIKAIKQQSEQFLKILYSVNNLFNTQFKLSTVEIEEHIISYMKNLQEKNKENEEKLHYYTQIFDKIGNYIRFSSFDQIPDMIQGLNNDLTKANTLNKLFAEKLNSSLSDELPNVVDQLVKTNQKLSFDMSNFTKKVSFLVEQSTLIDKSSAINFSTSSISLGEFGNYEILVRDLSKNIDKLNAEIKNQKAKNNELQIQHSNFVRDIGILIKENDEQNILPQIQQLIEKLKNVETEYNIQLLVINSIKKVLSVESNEEIVKQIKKLQNSTNQLITTVSQIDSPSTKSSGESPRNVSLSDVNNHLVSVQIQYNKLRKQFDQMKELLQVSDYNQIYNSLLVLNGNHKQMISKLLKLSQIYEEQISEDDETSLINFITKRMVEHKELLTRLDEIIEIGSLSDINQISSRIDTMKTFFKKIKSVTSSNEDNEMLSKITQMQNIFDYVSERSSNADVYMISTFLKEILKSVINDNSSFSDLNNLMHDVKNKFEVLNELLSQFHTENCNNMKEKIIKMIIFVNELKDISGITDESQIIKQIKSILSIARLPSNSLLEQNDSSPFSPRSASHLKTLILFNNEYEGSNSPTPLDLNLHSAISLIGEKINLLEAIRTELGLDNDDEVIPKIQFILTFISRLKSITRIESENEIISHLEMFMSEMSKENATLMNFTQSPSFNKKFSLVDSINKACTQSKIVNILMSDSQEGDSTKALEKLFHYKELIEKLTRILSVDDQKIIPKIEEMHQSLLNNNIILRQLMEMTDSKNEISLIRKMQEIFISNYTNPQFSDSKSETNIYEEFANKLIRIFNIDNLTELYHSIKQNGDIINDLNVLLQLNPQNTSNSILYKTILQMRNILVDLKQLFNVEKEDQIKQAAILYKRKFDLSKSNKLTPALSECQEVFEIVKIQLDLGSDYNIIDSLNKFFAQSKLNQAFVDNFMNFLKKSKELHFDIDINQSLSNDVIEWFIKYIKDSDFNIGDHNKFMEYAKVYGYIGNSSLEASNHLIEYAINKRKHEIMQAAHDEVESLRKSCDAKVTIVEKRNKELREALQQSRKGAQEVFQNASDLQKDYMERESTLQAEANELHNQLSIEKRIRTELLKLASGQTFNKDVLENNLKKDEILLISTLLQ